MKRTSFVISLCALAAWLGANGKALATPLSSHGYAIQNGDVNGDHDRDLSDAISLLGFLYSGGGEPVPLALCAGGPTAVVNGDANADGDIDVSDAVSLVGWLFLGTQPPAEPCGDGAGAAKNSNPRVIPPQAKPYGSSYEQWGIDFFTFVYSIPLESNPFVGAGICDSDSPKRVNYLPAPFGSTNHCTVEPGKALLLPAAVYLNDYPCPDPAFEPAPGQSLEDFLKEGAAGIIDLITNIQIEVDGVLIENVERYRLSTDLFHFTSHPSLVAIDPCVTGESQPAVVDGYFLMFTPFAPGEHVLRISIDFAGSPVPATTNFITVLP